MRSIEVRSKKSTEIVPCLASNRNFNLYTQSKNKKLTITTLSRMMINQDQILLVKSLKYSRIISEQ